MKHNLRPPLISTQILQLSIKCTWILHKIWKVNIVIIDMSVKRLVYRSSRAGPGCSKLTMSLVNDSLKFTSSDTQICRNFLLKKCEHIFSAKNIRILCIESPKTVNEMTLNELVKLTTLWTTGPWSLLQQTTLWNAFYSFPRKLGLTVHVNRLLACESSATWMPKNNKTNFRMSSA